MDWKDVVSKIRLVDINAKLESEQVGVVNVKVEDKSQHFHFYDPEAVKAFMEAPKTPELERAIHMNSTARLKNVVASPLGLSGTTRTEMAASSTATASLDVVKKSTSA